MTPAQEEIFNKQLKESVKLRDVKADESLPDTTDKLAEQLKEFHAAIHSSKRNEIYMKSLMGRNITKIQAETGMKGAKFITFVQGHLTDYKQSEIYFMMKFNTLCELYPRLSYVTIGSGILKSKLKMIEKLLKRENTYWRNVERSSANK